MGIASVMRRDRENRFKTLQSTSKLCGIPTYGKSGIRLRNENRGRGDKSAQDNENENPHSHLVGRGAPLRKTARRAQIRAVPRAACTGCGQSARASVVVLGLELAAEDVVVLPIDHDNASIAGPLMSKIDRLVEPMLSWSRDESCTRCQRSLG